LASVFSQFQDYNCSLSKKDGEENISQSGEDKDTKNKQNMCEDVAYIQSLL